MRKGFRFSDRADMWTPEQLDQLGDLLLEGLSIAEIGRRIGRSANAVEVKRKRIGLPSRSARFLSARDLATLFGRSHPRGHHTYIKHGLRFYRRERRVKPGTGQRERPYYENGRFFFRIEDVYDWMADERSWPYWEPSQITDPLLREYGRELREPFVTIADVARKFWVTRETVTRWIKRGLLPRVGRGRIPASAIAGFVPPFERRGRR